jgi:signal transduction histidine kinase
LLSAFGFEQAELPVVAGDHASALATFAASETFRWLRRWAVVAVVAIVTPITVTAAYASQMPEFHHVAVPIAVAIIVPAWVLELSGVRWPRAALIAATVVPNVWLTLIGHVSTNYLWLLLLVPWVTFAGTLVEGVVALALASATVALSVLLAPPAQADWTGWIEWTLAFLLTWFMGLVLRRQVVLVAELRTVRGESEERARQVAVLEERQRLSRELHDSVTQALYGISLYTEAAGRALAEGDQEPVATNLHDIRETTQEALGEMRLLLFELRPPLLHERGLAGALRARLQAVEGRTGLATEFTAEREERLPPNIEQELYRLAQEALNNVLKHAHATRVTVRMTIEDLRARLEVADDGIGFEPSLQGAGGLGLGGMRERVQRLGGTLHIESSPGAGTAVRVEVPR